MKKWLALLVCALAFGLVAAGCGGDDEEDSGGDSAETTQQQDTGAGATTGGGEEAAPADSSEVAIGDNFFEPKDVTVKAGSTIKWTNEGQAPHTVTHTGGPGEKFDSGNLDPGSDFEQSFDEAGKIDYVCTIHAGQSGTITVE